MQTTPSCWEVRAGSYDSARTVKRFTDTLRGEVRAKAYAEAYNTDLMRGLGLSAADITLRHSDRMSDKQYELANKAEIYRSESAYVSKRAGVEIVEDHDPMPSDYDHGY